MIEADVFLGKLTIVGGTDKDDQVIMAHGPNEVESDLSLENFINQVNDHNKDKPADTVKGIKLDFKSVEAFSKATEILKNIVRFYYVWSIVEIMNVNNIFHLIRKVIMKFG